MDSHLSFAQKFGNRLKYLRLLRSFTQSELALQIGLSTKQYGRIERGLATPPISVLEKLSIALETPAFNLFLHDVPRPVAEAASCEDKAFTACLPANQRLCPSVRLATWILEDTCSLPAWSASLFVMLGYKPFEVKPLLNRFLRHVDPSQRTTVSGFLVAARRKGSVESIDDQSMVLRVTTRDMRQKTLMLFAVAASVFSSKEIEGGVEVTVRMIVLLDVTECQALNSALACNQSELEAYVQKRNKELAKAMAQYEQEAAQRMTTVGELRICERMVQYSQNAQVYIDASGVIQAVNAAYIARSGVISTRFVRRKYLDVMAERWGWQFVHDTVAPRLAKALTGMAASYRQWLDYSSNGKRFISVTYSPCFGDLSNLVILREKVVGVVVTIHDLTEEEQARQEMERFKFAVDSSLAPTAMADTDNILTHVNPAFLEAQGQFVLKQFCNLFI